MATKIGQELVEFTFGQEKTDLGNGVLGYDPKNLDRFTKAVETYERELKRVFGSLVTTVSQIDQATGQAMRKIYLPRTYEQEALGVRSAVDKQLFGKTGMNSNQAKSLMYQEQANAHFLETTREIKGAKAQQFAKESVIEVGGKIIHTPNTANKDMMTTFIPVSDAQLSSMSNKDVATYIKDITPASNSASRAEQAERTRREKEKEKELQLEHEAQRQRDNLKERRKQNEAQKKADERKQREEAKAEAREEKEKIASRKHLLGRIGKVVAILTTIADVARRILTSVMNFGSEYSKTATKANTLNIGAQDIRSLDYFDKALGLQAGTQVQAQEDLRSKFGNTAKIDTEALKWLAMVMGDKVGQLVQSGIGGENPAYLMEQIIDDFYKRQQEGKDQYGNYVGQDKARRSLVTLLESVSPSIARTFERMVEEQTSGLHAGEVTSYRQFQSLYTPAQGGTSALDWENLSKFGKTVDSIKADFEELGKTLKVTVAGALTNFVAKLDNIQIGKNTEEKVEENLTDYKKLASWRNTYTGQRNAVADKLNALAKGAGFGGIDAVISAVGDDENARSFIENLSATENWADLVRYIALGNIIEDIKKQESAPNPNASDLLFGDTGVTDYIRGALSTSAVLQQYGNPWELTFSPNDYVTYAGESGVGKMTRLSTTALKYSDYTATKQGLIRGGAKSFFDVANLGGMGSNYGDIVMRALRKYASVEGGVSFGDSDEAKWAKFTSYFENAEKYGWDSESGQMLLDLFAFMTGEASLGWGKGGLSKKQLKTVQDIARSAEDEFGLSPLENQSINEMRELGMQRFKNFKWDRIVVTEGATAGTLNINFQQTLNGEVVATETLTTSGDMRGEKDITFSTTATVNEANEVIAR